MKRSVKKRIIISILVFFYIIAFIFGCLFTSNSLSNAKATEKDYKYYKELSQEIYQKYDGISFSYTNNIVNIEKEDDTLYIYKVYSDKIFKFDDFYGIKAIKSKESGKITVEKYKDKSNENITIFLSGLVSMYFFFIFHVVLYYIYYAFLKLVKRIKS